MVHIVNLFRFKMVFTSELSLYLEFEYVLARFSVNQTRKYCFYFRSQIFIKVLLSEEV